MSRPLFWILFFAAAVVVTVLSNKINRFVADFLDSKGGLGIAAWSLVVAAALAVAGTDRSTGLCRQQAS